WTLILSQCKAATVLNIGVANPPATTAAARGATPPTKARHPLDKNGGLGHRAPENDDVHRHDELRTRADDRAGCTQAVSRRARRATLAGSVRWRADAIGNRVGATRRGRERDDR